MLIERIAKSFTSLPSSLDALRSARVLVRRAGPFFSINIVITTIEVHEGSAGDLHATVHLAGSEPVQDVVTAQPPEAAVTVGAQAAVAADDTSAKDIHADAPPDTAALADTGTTADVQSGRRQDAEPEPTEVAGPASSRLARRSASSARRAEMAAPTKRSPDSAQNTTGGSRPRRTARPRNTPPRHRAPRSQPTNGRPEDDSTG